LKFYLLRRTYFSSTGQFQKALKFDALYDSLNSKIFEESRIKVAELQKAYELSERDQQLSLQQQALRLQLAEINKKNFLNRMITIGGLFLVGIALWLFYLYKLNARLRYKNEALAREQNHRVKNNLQMIASLLSVQSSSHADETIKTVLTQNENRIQSVALLHRMLYENELSSSVSMHQYVDDLVTELKEALGARNAAFQLNIELEHLPIEKTISIGLILNELITNSVKYASYSESLQIAISLIRNEGNAELQYADNGRNFQPSDFHESDNFGARLITIQAKQLKGKYNITNKGGFHFVLSFPIL
jgi:two-component sensor histidine kinase